MYRYYITTPNNLETIEITPLNSIEIKGDRAESEVYYLEQVNNIKLKGDDFKFLKQYEGIDFGYFKFIIKNSNIVIYEGVFNLFNDVRYCDCDLEISINTNSVIDEFLENQDNEYNILDSDFGLNFVDLTSEYSGSYTEYLITREEYNSGISHNGYLDDSGIWWGMRAYYREGFTDFYQIVYSRSIFYVKQGETPVLPTGYNAYQFLKTIGCNDRYSIYSAVVPSQIQQGDFNITYEEPEFNINSQYPYRKSIDGRYIINTTTSSANDHIFDKEYSIGDNNNSCVSRCFRLNDLIERLAIETSSKITSFQSSFFMNSINPVTSIEGQTNNIYLKDSSELNNYLEITENATNNKLSFSELYEFLKQTYDVRMFIDGSVLRIEHISFFYNDSYVLENNKTNNCYSYDEIREIEYKENINTNYDIKYLKKYEYSQGEYYNVNAGKISYSNTKISNGFENVGVFFQPFNYGFKSDSLVYIITDDFQNVLFPFTLEIDNIVRGNQGVKSFEYFKRHYQYREKFNVYKFNDVFQQSFDSISLRPLKTVSEISCCLNSEINNNIFTTKKVKTNNINYIVDNYTFSLKNKTLTFNGRK